MKQDQAILRKDGWHHYLDGQEVTQAEYEQRYPPPQGSGAPAGGTWKRSILSDALAIHPRDLQRHMELDKLHGAVVDYVPTPEGLLLPKLEDRDQRRRYLKRRGVFDRDAGYGDQTRQSRDVDAGPLPEYD